MVEAPPDSYELTLARGIAELLDALELGNYDPSLVYEPTERGIFTNGKLPTTIPECIVLRVFPFTRTSRTSGYNAVQLFIRMEGMPQVAANVAGQIRGALEGRTHAYLNGLGIGQITFASGQEFEQDPSKRGSYALNLNFFGRNPIVNTPQIGA